MALQLVRAGPHFVPQVICEGCNKPIKDAMSGVIQFPTAWQDAPIPLSAAAFTHTDCMLAYQRQRQGVGFSPQWATQSLDLLPVLLAQSLGVDIAQAAENAKLLQTVGGGTSGGNYTSPRQVAQGSTLGDHEPLGGGAGFGKTPTQRNTNTS